MSHPEQHEFVSSVRAVYPEYFTYAKVLEVGSLDINGSVRDLFTDCEYVGVDLDDGPGVDLVGEGQELKFPDQHFDTSISAECFEHNPYWAQTFLNMYRMTTGLVIFTCATHGRPEHGTTRTSPADSPFTLDWDYYRNLGEADFRRVFNIDGMFTDYAFSTNTNTHDLYFWGRR